MNLKLPACLLLFLLLLGCQSKPEVSQDYALIFIGSSLRTTDNALVDPIDKNAFFIEGAIIYNELVERGVLPENIYLARIKHFYPSFEVEVAQHIKDRWKPFVWRKFKFDLLGAIKLGLKCTFWPFALMPLYLRALRGYGKLEDIFAYVFVLSVGFPYLLGPFLRTIFQ